ncbi:MAG: 7-cyano-7-deazaguanine synthase QueC [Epsilonproteobacteria bacterium]|nr:7-cyano-7-deazaguanine synthase QueC [Campylobacterota bacterium]NPA57111.1 7-cyano-7-deazaguanine synthase QueC [Campylobacterota bacterium]
MKKAVAIVSGGMDSSLTAAIAREEGYQIVAVHFSYGQRTEKRELQAFREISQWLGAERYEIELPFFNTIGASALIDRTMAVPTDGIKPGIPITYVPFRNGIFLSIATAIAEKEGAEAIYIGVVEEDSSGYPDCRETFIEAMERAINLGTRDETQITIKTPLIHLKKEEIVSRALQLNLPLHLTWSCYQGEEEACGVCDSCRLRLKGFQLAGVEDPLPYKRRGER